jgi:uncharacterized protein (TIGR03545 family)
MIRRLFRWKAIIPLVLFVGLVIVAWILLLDKLVERGVEQAGESVVGAKVDLEGATVHLAAGSVQLRQLQVADPDSPMQNLFEASEILAAISPAPLLEKKIVIDSILVRGVRFGTPRKESGALKDQSSTSGLILRQVNQWARQVRIPSLSLEGLGGKVINIPAISADSLRTVSQARRIVASADSLRQSWEGQMKSLDPSPRIDSAKAVLERLKAADPKALGAQGMTKLLSDARGTINDVTGTLGKVKGLETTVVTGVGRVKADAVTLDDARRADYAYARGLVHLPSLDAPDISPALFGQIGIEKLKPILYWVNLAEKYLPPGLDPRTRTGPKRARASGIDVDFPREKSYPKFLLRFADIDVSLTGQGLAAGNYRAQAAGFTTEPALYGRPMQFALRRTGGQAGPNTAQVFVQLDHTKVPMRDSAVANIGGLTLPTVPVTPLGAKVALGEGAAEFSLSRVGEKLVGRWHVRTANASWVRTDSTGAPAGGKPADKAKDLAQDLVWRTVAAIKDVDIDAQISGTLQNPSLTVRSNVGDAVANSLKKAVGEEVARAEQLVRSRVDSLVADGRRQVDEKVAVLQTQFQDRITQEREQLEQVKAELEAKVKEKASGITGGIQLPGGIKLPK